MGRSNIEGREGRSRRFNLMLTPSLYKDIETLSALNGCSVNEQIIKALSEYVKENQKMLDDYKALLERIPADVLNARLRDFVKGEIEERTNRNE